MSAFPGSPQLLKGGIVLIDPASGAVRRVIALQYNPDALTRMLQLKTAKEDGAASATSACRPPAWRLHPREV